MNWKLPYGNKDCIVIQAGMLFKGCFVRRTKNYRT